MILFISFYPFWLSWIINFTSYNIHIYSYPLYPLYNRLFGWPGQENTVSHPLTWFEVQLSTDHFHLGQLGFIQGDVRVVEVAHGVPGMPMISLTCRAGQLHDLVSIQQQLHRIMLLPNFKIYVNITQICGHLGLSFGPIPILFPKWLYY